MNRISVSVFKYSEPFKVLNLLDVHCISPRLVDTKVLASETCRETK